jgi:hypothetical protein
MCNCSNVREDNLMDGAWEFGENSGEFMMNTTTDAYEYGEEMGGDA